MARVENLAVSPQPAPVKPPFGEVLVGTPQLNVEESGVKGPVGEADTARPMHWSLPPAMPGRRAAKNIT